MSAIPLGKGAFERIGAPETRLVNMLYEQSPANQEDQVSLIQRPGLVPFKTCGAGPIRGIVQFNAFLIVVSGTELYKITSGGTVLQISGTIAGTKRVSMATDGTEVVIASGAGLYRTDAFTLSSISIGGSPVSGQSVAYIAGYFLVSRVNEQRVDLGARDEDGVLSFDLLGYFNAEFAPDILVSINVVGDYLYLIGSASIEPWTPSGNADAPFQRMRGRLFNVGTADKSTVCQLDNTLFFVGNDRIAYRLAGVPTRVSDHGIDERLRAATDLRAWSYVLDGHGLWVVATGNETLVHDVTTGQWTEFSSHGLGYFRAHLGIQTDPTAVGAASVATLGADAVDGTIWTLTSGVSRDDGGPLVREWTGALDVSGALARCDSVRLDCTVGSAALDEDPLVELRVSDDWKTWSDWRGASLGRSGEYGACVAWTRLGLVRSPGRLFHFRTSADCDVAVRRAGMNERLR